VLYPYAFTISEVYSQLVTFPHYPLQELVEIQGLVLLFYVPNTMPLVFEIHVFRTNLFIATQSESSS
jgi:hypothetical protein